MKRFVFFFVLLSCQPIEIIEPVIFDNDQLSSISINAKNIEIKQTYEPKFIDPYIDHSLEQPPIERIKSWIQTNVNTFGKKNELKINILDASIKKIEEQNLKAKKFEETDIYKYELFYLIEFSLYDDTSYLIASTIVESFRSTTSGRFISILETEKIIDDLILESLRDITKESKRLIILYMSDYIL
tara:strand:+ start:293 stop:850 length:558 start_codon:yes stop_codon:yes gene_type:complete